MFTTILVPLDGSSLAERALPFAARLARCDDATVVLARALPPDGTEAPGAAPAALANARATTDEIAGRLRADGIAVQVVTRQGPAADVILHLARENAAGLIVMATHGRGGLGRQVFGSVANAVMRRADVPVLFVPMAGRPSWPGQTRLHALVPLDGSPLAEAGLAVGIGLGLDLTLMRVVEGEDYIEPHGPACPECHAVPSIGNGATPGVAPARVQRYLDKAIRSLPSRSGVTVRRRAVIPMHAEIGYPAETIARLATEEDAHLILMATHGVGGPKRLAIGDVALGTLAAATVPVLFVPPTMARPRTEPAPVVTTTPTAPGHSIVVI
ncbi:MAG: universal stress protein [Chloroflexi bacterium]|nr:universal stress protein [Chloroflexota bacterium]